jgi:pimeloyl-ACP methyl ester carboxylesterase
MEYMSDYSETADYEALDRPEVLTRLFHPRRELPATGTVPNGYDVMIQTEEGAAIGGRFHAVHPSGANILFFHGNGEIVADYDELGPLFNRMGINFLPVDYRGYGRSTGHPTVSAMMRDCRIIFDFTVDWLKTKGYSGPLAVMGRSLGSASAIELSSRCKDDIAGLIIESGFAYAGPLLHLLGIDTVSIGFEEESGFRNVDKIAQFNRATLIIHAEYDHIIPFSDGKALYDACSAADKTFLKIPGANHNDIFMRGLESYLTAVKNLAERL